jgi:hypothetical protein
VRVYFQVISSAQSKLCLLTHLCYCSIWSHQTQSVTSKSIERVSTVSTSAFHSTQASARRWLQLTAAACLTALLVACGGSGGGSAAVASVDAGSAESQPWKAVFNGASSLTFNAIGCSGPEGSTETAVITLTRGTNTFVASITSGSVTVGPMTFGDESAYYYYSLGVGTGTSTSVNLQAYTNSHRFEFYTDSTGPQTIRFGSNFDVIYCSQVTNPLTRAQLSLQPQARLASFLAGSPTAVVSSADSAPDGCYVSGGRTHTYAISPQGVVQIDGQTLAANWLDTVNSTNASYSEYIYNYPPSAYRDAGIYFSVDSEYRGVYVERTIYGPSTEFNHYCGGD